MSTLPTACRKVACSCNNIIPNKMPAVGSKTTKIDVVDAPAHFIRLNQQKHQRKRPAQRGCKQPFPLAAW